MFNSDLRDFIYSQDFFNIKSIQVFENTKKPITMQSRNVWKYMSICNYDSLTLEFHNERKKIKAKFGFVLFCW